MLRSVVPPLVKYASPSTGSPQSLFYASGSSGAQEGFFVPPRQRLIRASDTEGKYDTMIQRRVAQTRHMAQKATASRKQ